MMRRIINRMKNFLEPYSYKADSDDYDAAKYWKDRHNKYDTNTLKGVGNSSKAEDENFAEYESAKYIFKGLLEEFDLLKPKKVLELGYGTGFYTMILNGLTSNYLGVDIVDTHAKLIREKMGGNLEKCDIGVEKIEFKECDLIYTIDVSDSAYCK